MAKLYWRVTINGKRTWRPATVLTVHLDDDQGRTSKTYEVEGYEESKSES